MNIALKPEAKKLLKRLVAEGQYASEGEALNAAVMQLEDDSWIDWDWIARAVAEADASVAKGDFIEVDKRGLKKLTNDIKRRGRERLAKKRRGP